jgi:hypothetical protein
MIVRNVAADLDRCLESVKGAVDSIHVTDTGSVDDTREIARRHGARMKDFPWVNDFSAARNHSMGGIAEDWILILDADDEFPPGEADRIRPWLKMQDALTLTLEYEVDCQYTAAPVRRVLRNHRALSFSGVIHESIRACLPESRTHTVDTDVRLHHRGNTPATQARKHRRNLPLLRREWERCQSVGDTYQRCHVGKELAQTLIHLGESAEGESLLLRLLADSSARQTPGEAVSEAFATLLWHLHASQRHVLAWDLARQIDPYSDDTPAHPLYRGLAAFHVGAFAGALADFETFERNWREGRIRVPVPQCYTGLALQDLKGQCLLNTGRPDEAVACFEQCRQLAPEAREYEVKRTLARREAAHD